MTATTQRKPVVIVGADGSPQQPAVLAAATEHAMSHGGVIHLVRAMTIPSGMPSAAWAFGVNDLGSFLVDHALRDLNAIREQLPLAVRGELIAQLGQPHDVLIEAAREHDASLMVVGTHGYSLVERMLGTTAGRVVTHAPCSVLVVKA